MKRMIACEKCGWHLTPHFAGEWFKRVRGIAKRGMLCDYCGTEIKKGDKCSAESVGFDEHGIPYYPWESEYIELSENK